jgi:hypothetical protein
VAADVEQRVDLVFLAAHDDDGLFIELEQEPVTHIGNFTVVPGVQPGFQEYFLDIPAIDVRIPVKSLFERKVITLPGSQSFYFLRIQRVFYSRGVLNL